MRVTVLDFFASFAESFANFAVMIFDSRRQFKTITAKDAGKLNFAHGC